MRFTVALAIVLFSSWMGDASEKKLREISWKALSEQGSLTQGLEVGSDGSLSVRSSGKGGVALTLTEIGSPGITRDQYVVRGTVRYRAVEGNAYLEMWNLFGDGGHYFTRTLADSGPLQRISGSSEWREFGLFFDKTGAKAPVEKLIIGIVLPGQGEVSLSDMTLVELDGGPPPNDAARWGGIAGALLGAMGALLGSLAGAGRGRTFVLFGMRAMMVAGAVGLALGLFALARSASYQSYYPLLLLSAISLAIPAFSLPGIRKRYEEIELRRMRALDT